MKCRSPCLRWWQLNTPFPIRVLTSWWLEVNCELSLSVRSLQPSPTGCSCSPEQLWHKNSAGGRHSCPQLQELGSPGHTRAGNKAPSLPPLWNGGPFFPKTHRWSHGYISAFISPCTHPVHTQQLCCLGQCRPQSPQELGRKVYPARGPSGDWPPQRRSGPLNVLLLCEKLFPWSHLQYEHCFCLFSFSLQKIPAFNKDLKREREKGWTCQRLLLLLLLVTGTGEGGCLNF